MSETVQSAFESEVETYREAMDDLHTTAARQGAHLEGLDAAMSTLQESVAEMTDAVDEYDEAIAAFDEAVVSLGEHARDDATRETASAATPIAGD